MSISLKTASSVEKLMNKLSETPTMDTLDVFLQNFDKVTNAIQKHFDVMVKQIPPRKSGEGDGVDSFNDELKDVEKNDANNNLIGSNWPIYLIKSLPYFNYIIELNKNLEGLLDNPRFINNLHSYLWNCIQYYGWGHKRLKNFTAYIVATINERTKENYIVNKCFNEYDYVCGRALEKNIEPNKINRLIIFGTESKESDFIDDKDYERRIKPTLSYYQKYLKYKNKYLALKNKLNI